MFAEDLPAFLGDFGVDGTLAGQPVRVIFDDPGAAPQGISVREPQVQLPTASVPAGCYQAALVIPQGSFTVREHLPDGTGWSVLLLSTA
jgi:hypothetical protein